MILRSSLQNKVKRSIPFCSCSYSTRYSPRGPAAKLIPSSKADRREPNKSKGFLYPNFIQNNRNEVADSKDVDNEGEWIRGRIRSIRKAGKKLIFLDISHNNNDGTSQVLLNARDFKSEHFDEIATLLSIGDIYEFYGTLGTTPSGQASLFAKEARLLAPCLHRIPVELKNEEVMLRNPTLNFLANPASLERLKLRSKLISNLRNYLNARGFYEFETPILSSLAGGANARPFTTTMTAMNDLELQLRIAPELYLKQLIVGGMDKVYEIGKQFRNEGIDSTHNPEFTTCELYQTFVGVEEMMEFTEILIKELYEKSNMRTQDSPLLTIAVNGQEILLDMSSPFRKLNVCEELKRFFSPQLLPALDEQSSIPQLIDLCEAHSIPIPAVRSLSQILDKIVGFVVETQCIQPTFIYGHPIALSPLARESPQLKGTSDRFELFIGGKEYANAYSELNIPSEQRDRFKSQQKDKDSGDGEAQVLDEGFCESLEYGLAPTVGLGIGIDRLCMLICNSRHIRDVLAFPISRPIA